MQGYRNIQDYIENYCKPAGYDVDIFLHTWWDKANVGARYACSTWSNVTGDDTIIADNIVDELCKLYNPVAFAYEPPRDFAEEVEACLSLELYHALNEEKKKNVANFYSNLYSKNAVSRVLADYCACKEKVVYDVILTCRYDMLLPITFSLEGLCDGAIYTRTTGNSRFYLCDSFLAFTRMDDYMHYSAVYHEIMDVNASEACKGAARDFGIGFEFNIEEIITLHMILHYSREELRRKVVFRKDVPNCR